jgi:hypothetical protein
VTGILESNDKVLGDGQGVTGGHLKQGQTVFFYFACSRKYARSSNPQSDFTQDPAAADWPQFVPYDEKVPMSHLLPPCGHTFMWYTPLNVYLQENLHCLTFCEQSLFLPHSRPLPLVGPPPLPSTVCSSEDIFEIASSPLFVSRTILFHLTECLIIV